MQVYSINSLSFQKYGKPLDLKYIMEKRSYLLPERVINEIKLSENSRSLKDIHLSIYAPLLNCKTLDEVKAIFPEFKGIKDSVEFVRNSTYRKTFEELTENINFPLKILQEYWAKIKTKDEIAKDLGMPGRTSLEWILKQIGFVGYGSNYKTLLEASSKEGNKTIAEKTRAHNLKNPDVMYERNKHAAQFCKTPEYREAQRERILKYDNEHPERKAKISEANKRTWEQCPEIKKAMSEFAKKESPYVRKVVMDKIKGKILSEKEIRVDKGFYKRFWQEYPELKQVFADAKKKTR